MCVDVCVLSLHASVYVCLQISGAAQQLLWKPFFARCSTSTPSLAVAKSKMVGAILSPPFSKWWHNAEMISVDLVSQTWSEPSVQCRIQISVFLLHTNKFKALEISRRHKSCLFLQSPQRGFCGEKANSLTTAHKAAMYDMNMNVKMNVPVQDDKPHHAGRRTLTSPNPLKIFYQMIACLLLTGRSPTNLWDVCIKDYNHRKAKLLLLNQSLDLIFFFRAILMHIGGVANWCNTRWSQQRAIGDSSGAVSLSELFWWRAGLSNIKESWSIAGGANNALKREENKTVQRPSPKMRGFNYHSQKLADSVRGEPDWTFQRSGEAGWGSLKNSGCHLTEWKVANRTGLWIPSVL